MIISFDFWMFKRAYDVFVLVVNFLGNINNSSMSLSVYFKLQKL